MWREFLYFHCTVLLLILMIKKHCIDFKKVLEQGIFFTNLKNIFFSALHDTLKEPQMPYTILWIICFFRLISRYADNLHYTVECFSFIVWRCTNTLCNKLYEPRQTLVSYNNYYFTAYLGFFGILHFYINIKSVFCWLNIDYILWVEKWGKGEIT